MNVRGHPVWLDDISTDKVDGQASLPLHRQLSSVLRESIADGSLPSGTQLPTEAAFQEKFGISRSVVRQTLSDMAGEGLILRGRGRGSVVAPHVEHHREVQRVSGLAAQISPSSGYISTQVLTLAPGWDAQAQHALGTAEMLSLRRRRSAEDEALAIIQTWLPMSLAASLTTMELTDASLHEVLAEHSGAPITAGRRQIRSVPASAQVASELRVEPGAPLLLLEGVSLDNKGAAVEYFSTWHRADRVVFDLEVVHDRTAISPGAAAPLSGTHSARASALAEQLKSLADELGADGL